ALIVAALALADRSAQEGAMTRTLHFLGDISYSLYLIHPIAITLPRRLFSSLVVPAISPWLYAGLLLMGALVGAAVVHLLFERPVTRFLQKQIANLFRRKELSFSIAT